jgi:The GLUG motif.
MRKNSAIMFFVVLLYIAHAQEIWNGEIDTDWYFNNQYETEFTINSAEELAGLAMLASSEINFEGKTVILGQNIVLNDTVNWKGWINSPPANINKWIPIGPNNTLLFNGTFDGNGHVISGIYINDPANDRQSLFGYLGTNGEIKNLGVTASYIKGDYYAGGLVGWNSGEINGCYSSAWVFGGMFFTGGLVGRNSGGTIHNSYSIGTVKGENFVGGIAGQIEGGAIINSYSVSEVTGTGSSVGGLVGGIHANGGTITNSYYNLADMTFEDFEGWDFDNIWGIDDKVNNGYPYLLWSAKTSNIRLPQIAGSQINIKTIGNAIVLENLPKNAKIKIYNLQGKRIYSAHPENPKILRILVQTKGVYIMKAGTQIFRITIK